MSDAPAFVTSDIHLGAVPDETERAFRAWLRWAGQRASSIVINGDLFDFWFEYRTVIPRGYTRTLGLLGELVDQGIPIHLIGGNHDWWGGSYLSDEVGLTFHRGPVELDLAGHRCLIAHGDGLGRGDLGYRLLRMILRGSLTRWAFRWIHPDLGATIARRVSRTDVRIDGRAEIPPDRANELARWARDRLLEDPGLDLILLGHVHRPQRVEVAPGRFYLNSGDWLHHRSFAVLPSGEPAYLAAWDGERPAELEGVQVNEDPDGGSTALPR